MLRRPTLTLLLVALTAVLYGCGNKGDLYLPEESAETFYPSNAELQE
ncbi:MAG: lipoprotein [Cellvibrionales bacterium]|tara:strand:- start:7811 stop:7951 length:141 start_codon:yes stop_codon:yes gene_type:complete